MIGVIADDLTGAAEIGAIGLRHGLRPEIVFSGKPGGDADLVCIDTDSRAQTPAAAAKNAAAAAKLLRNAGAKWIYKKVDSVLRGNVIAEIEAVMAQLELNQALLAPANPSLGRIIRDGKYFVRGKPIHRSEFASDPHFPRRSAHVLELLPLPMNLSLSLGKLETALLENGIVVAEAASSAQVQQWAARWNSSVLPAGGAEFFNALLSAQNLESPIPPSSNFFEDDSRELFISGTSSVSSRKFSATARREKTPVFSLPQELAWGADLIPAAVEAIGQRIVAAFESHSRVVLNIGLPPVHNRETSEKLCEHVTRIAANVLRRINVSHVFSEGGATSAALSRHMDWKRLTVVRELAPGVATLLADGEKKILLTIKPGSYSWPPEITRTNHAGNLVG